MAYSFTYRHANLIAYLSSGPLDAPPRATRNELGDLLDALMSPDPNVSPLLSSDDDWLRRVGDVAAAARDRLAQVYRRARRAEGDQLEGSDVREALSPLVGQFRGFLVYGLVTAWEGEAEPTLQLATAAASRFATQALFVCPNQFPRPTESWSIFDPNPVLHPFLHEPAFRPGIVFWTSSGASRFVIDERVPSFLDSLASAFENSATKISAEKAVEEYRPPITGSTRVLHLSDLHLGITSTERNLRLLQRELENVGSGLDGTVVTGDLMNSPNDFQVARVQNFLDWLARLTIDRPVIVPGNHDARTQGNRLLGIGDQWRYLMNLGLGAPGAAYAAGCIFLCFHSVEAGTLARGLVSRDQLTEVGASFEGFQRWGMDKATAPKMALVHHYPFRWTDSEPQIVPGWRRLFRRVKGATLEMEGADDLMGWCARRGVELILFGHRHIPRHVVRSVRWSDGKSDHETEVVAIGCGSSLGKNGPLSYNVIQWNPRRKRWSVEFWVDPGDGSGFVLRYFQLIRLAPLVLPDPYS